MPIGVRVKTARERRLLENILPKTLPHQDLVLDVIARDEKAMLYFNHRANYLDQKYKKKKRIRDIKIDDLRSNMIQDWLIDYAEKRHNQIILLKKEAIPLAIKKNIIGDLNRYYQYSPTWAEAYFNKISQFKYNTAESREYYNSTGVAPYNLTIRHNDRGKTKRQSNGIRSVTRRNREEIQNGEMDKARVQGQPSGKAMRWRERCF